MWGSFKISGRGTPGALRSQCDSASRAPRSCICGASRGNHYEVLGLNETATEADIKKAFRKLALRLHPDVNKEVGAEKHFMEAKAAYETLSDDKKRAVYDRRRAQGCGNDGSGEEVTYVDLADLEAIFNGFGISFDEDDGDETVQMEWFFDLSGHTQFTTADKQPSQGPRARRRAQPSQRRRRTESRAQPQPREQRPEDIPLSEEEAHYIESVMSSLPEELQDQLVQRLQAADDVEDVINITRAFEMIAAESQFHDMHSTQSTASSTAQRPRRAGGSRASRGTPQGPWESAAAYEALFEGLMGGGGLGLGAQPRRGGQRRRDASLPFDSLDELHEWVEVEEAPSSSRRARRAPRGSGSTRRAR